MEHCLIAVRPKRQVTDNGSDTQVVGTEHQAYNKDYEPAESGFSGEAGTETGKNFINKYKHNVWSITGICGKLTTR